MSAEEEQARLLPVLEGILAARPDAVISVDTYKASTARAVLAAGAEIVNDVSGFNWDAEMAAVCAETKCGVVLMHARGRPDEWRGLPALTPDEVMGTVRAGLAASLAAAARAGIAVESVVLDPGYGFGKRFNENYALLARQDELLSLGRPLLAGVSRKSFLGQTLATLRGGQAAPAADARRLALQRWSRPFCKGRRSCGSTRCGRQWRRRRSRMRWRLLGLERVRRDFPPISQKREMDGAPNSWAKEHPTSRRTAARPAPWRLLPRGSRSSPTVRPGRRCRTACRSGHDR